MLYPESFSSGSAAGDGDCGQRRYRCYCYGRLSKEDGDKPESGSIKNQRDLLHDFLARRPDLELVMEGYDDGYTGTNFSRPYFIQMLKAIEDGTVNCVVVKDLSRFGREYIEAGQYLEKLFPAYGVRFISVSDGYDSLHSTASDGLMVPFKNLINDAYCRDTSLKIRSHFDVKRKKGQFIGAFAPYGYQKDPQDKNRLIPDEPAAAVVRRIFTWYTAGGMSKAAIAKQLNFLGIPNPSTYKRQQGLRYCNPAVQENSRLWTPGSVGYLLSNPVYNGTMVQGLG